MPLWVYIVALRLLIVSKWLYKVNILLVSLVTSQDTKHFYVCITIFFTYLYIVVNNDNVSILATLPFGFLKFYKIDYLFVLK